MLRSLVDQIIRGIDSLLVPGNRSILCVRKQQSLHLEPPKPQFSQKKLSFIFSNWANFIVRSVILFPGIDPSTFQRSPQISSTLLVEN
jgi:hypothetical protein